MCTGLEPLALAGIAASAGGSALNAKMQNDAISAQNTQNQIAMAREREARDAETQRQKQFEAQQADLVTNALFEAAPERVVETAEAASVDPEAANTTAADDYNVPTLTGQVQNEDVNESIGQTITSATQRTREMLRNAALLQGQNTSLSDAALALGRMGSESQTIGSNRRGSSNVAQMETRVPAAQVTKSDSMLGDLLMLGGQVAGGYAGKTIGASGGKSPFQLGSIFSSNRPLNAIPALGKVTV